MSLLLELRSYVEDRRSTSLLDISNRFNISPGALRGMLDHWIAKGDMTRQDFTICGACSSASGCSTCDNSAAFETYEWTRT